MMQTEIFDVIVIGGGPAGSTAATFLSMKGHKVLLLEKDTFPRFKVGESLLPATWEIWDKLGIMEEMEEAGFVKKEGVNFQMFNSPEELILRIGEYPEYFPRSYSYHVERARFDQILINNARRNGVDAREGWFVKDVLFEGQKAIGVLAGPNGEEPKPILATMVVDASGRACMLAGKLGRRKRDPVLNKISHYTHFTGAYRRGNHESTMTDIHTIDDGWIWYIPLANDVVSVGVVLDAKAAGRFKGTTQELFDKSIQSCDIIREWVKPGRQKMKLQTISSISYLNDCFIGDGFLMVGDASMFIDPIFSAGVTIAMRGAMFASDSIHEALVAGDVSASQFEAYEQKIRYPMQKIFKMIYNWYEILERKDKNNIFARARRMPLLRERFIVLLNGGYDKIDVEALLAEADQKSEVNNLV